MWLHCLLVVILSLRSLILWSAIFLFLRLLERVSEITVNNHISCTMGQALCALRCIILFILITFLYRKLYYYSFNTNKVIYIWQLIQYYKDSKWKSLGSLILKSKHLTLHSNVCKALSTVLDTQKH